MSDKNLQLELQRISHLFIPHQIGQGKDGWIVRGTLTSTATLEEVKQMVQNMSIEVFEQNGDITFIDE